MALKDIQYPEKGGVVGGIIGVIFALIMPILYILFHAFTSTWVLGIYGTLYSAKLLFLVLLCIFLPLSFIVGYLYGIMQRNDSSNIHVKQLTKKNINLLDSSKKVILKEIFPAKNKQISKKRIEKSDIFNIIYSK